MFTSGLRPHFLSGLAGIELSDPGGNVLTVRLASASGFTLQTFRQENSIRLMANSKKANVLVVDAEPVARHGLVNLINAHVALRVTGEADNLGVARELALRLKPEVVVLDPSMGDGLHFVKELARHNVRVVAFTSLDDAGSLERAFRAGIWSYVTRRDSIAAVLQVIAGAVLGERHVGPRIEHLLLDRLASGRVQFGEDDTAALSDRERQVYLMLGAGKSVRIIAGELGLSVKTIETHRQRIKGKLRLKNGAELQERALLSTSGRPRLLNGDQSPELSVINRSKTSRA